MDHTQTKGVKQNRLYVDT